MIKSGKYAIHGGNEYVLNIDMNGNHVIITSNEDYIDDSFVDKYGSGVYTKIIELAQLEEIYSITVYGIVNGERVFVIQERDGYYYVETPDCAKGNRLKLERVDKYEYGGWIHSDDIQIIEEKHYLKIEEMSKRMLSTEQVLQELNDLMGNYDRFAQIALEIPWIPVEEVHESASKPGTYWGFIVNLVHFPDGYVEQNFKEAYVRAALCSIIDSEEWDNDCFDISKEERRKCFCNSHSKEMYDRYMNFKEKRMFIRDEEYLRKEINCFAGANDISLDEQEKYLSYARDAVIIELGGCYSADFTYLVVKDDYIMFISCGVWD